MEGALLCPENSKNGSFILLRAKMFFTFSSKEVLQQHWCVLHRSFEKMRSGFYILLPDILCYRAIGICYMIYEEMTIFTSI